MKPYIECLCNIDTFCLAFKKNIVEGIRIKKFPSELRGWVMSSSFYQPSLDTLKGLFEIIDVFEIPYLDFHKKFLQNQVSLLENDEIIEKRDGFEKGIDPLIGFFSKETMQIIRDRLSVLKQEEIGRLDEAIHCFIQDCNYASVVMFVSAIESRLLLLMSSVCSENKSRLEEMPLGALIEEYLRNKEKYKNIVPYRHETLLKHCNNMRIFSVHPKKEIIDKSVAISILHMTFQFLLDKKISL